MVTRSRRPPTLTWPCDMAIQKQRHATCPNAMAMSNRVRLSVTDELLTMIDIYTPSPLP